MLPADDLLTALLISCSSCFLHLQEHHRALDDISPPSHTHTHSDDIQSIIQRITSAEIAHLLHNKYLERVRMKFTIAVMYILRNLTCLLSQTGLCSCGNAGEAFSSTATGKNQAAASQCVCDFFCNLPFSSYGNRLVLVDVSLCSEKLS